jgi:two-component system alkaline phosphatase synthesis response regulator PhoP
MEKIRILLIDDEPSFTRMLKLNLERAGSFKVLCENTGAFGLTAARDFLPDMIFLDVIMPDVDGGEVAAQIHADAKLKDVPIVFLTAGVSKETTRTKPVIGGRTFLAKPVSVDEVIRCIEKQLGKRAGVEPGSSASGA